MKKSSGVKVAAGVALIPPKKATSQKIRIHFGSFFTTGCKPVVTLGIMSPHNGRLIPTMHGISGINHVPDHRGLIARICVSEFNSKVNYFVKRGYLNWIAVGY
jgi:hypothetical protein